MTMFDHLAAMTDARGLYEHASGNTPRVEHGYCTDDNARMLLVTAREPDEGVPAALGRSALAFTLAAQTPDGHTWNRMSPDGEWTGQPTTDDCWGRSLWAFGVTAAQHDDPAVRAVALAAFEVGAQQRSPSPRSMAFAALGAADVIAEVPGHTAASELLAHAAVVIGAPPSGPWVWPEKRLTYANAALAEATIAAGEALDDWAVLDRGLKMLLWLVARDTRDGHLSVTGTQGADAATVGPQFDQQPIELAALADACWRAHSVTGHPRWRRLVVQAAEWFEGANDVGAIMHDTVTGGAFDGLTPDGVNLNQGAESTLAYISTTQRARSLARGVS